MSLKQTVYGGVCPLDKFGVDIAGGAGCYDKDPVEACLSCNFADNSSKVFDLEKICQCPQGMTWEKYDKLRKDYAASTKKLTKKGFQAYVTTKEESSINPSQISGLPRTSVMR